MDITVLVALQHDAMRSRFEAIDAMIGTYELTEAWAVLANLLKVHASGEESVLHPALARVAEEGAEEAEHADREHNELRDTAAAVRRHAAGIEDRATAGHRSGGSASDSRRRSRRRSPTARRRAR